MSEILKIDVGDDDSLNDIEIDEILEKIKDNKTVVVVDDINKYSKLLKKYIQSRQQLKPVKYSKATCDKVYKYWKTKYLPMDGGYNIFNGPVNSTKTTDWWQRLVMYGFLDSANNYISVLIFRKMEDKLLDNGGNVFYHGLDDDAVNFLKYFFDDYSEWSEWSDFERRIRDIWNTNELKQVKTGKIFFTKEQRKSYIPKFAIIIEIVTSFNFKKLNKLQDEEENQKNRMKKKTDRTKRTSRERSRSRKRSISRSRSRDERTPKIGEDDYEPIVIKRTVLFDPKSNDIIHIYYDPFVRFSNDLRGGYKSKKYIKYKRKSRKISS